MGINQSSIDPFTELIINKSFQSLIFESDRVHLTTSEMVIIETSVLRMMETNRRIETKLIQLSETEENVLEALAW